jgi:hypothetical protein
MKSFRAALSLLIAAAFPGQARAADCLLETAVYTQPESGYVLRFQPSHKLARFSGTTNVFFVDRPGAERPLTGWVIWNLGESRPGGRAMLDCPEDGMSEDDFADCTLWQGVMYALGERDAALLPGEKEPAPEAILLPDFGRQIRYSLVIDIGAEEVPWDVFRFKGCD